MNSHTQMLEKFTTDYAVPVAEAWNNFNHAATTGEADTIAAYVRYAVALQAADTARDTLKSSAYMQASRLHEERARQINAFENEFVTLRSEINSHRATKWADRAAVVAEKIAALNERINEFAEETGSDTYRAPTDETHLITLNYTEQPRNSSFTIPPRYGVPTYDTLTEAVAHIVQQQAK